MELIDLTKILKVGDEVYSSVFGENTKIIRIGLGDYPIITSLGDYSKYGQYFRDHPNAECVIFPSKTERDWSKYDRIRKLKVLVDEAKSKYPKGTIFECLYSHKKKVSSGEVFHENDASDYYVDDNELWVICDGICGNVYYYGIWANIVEEKCPFTHEQMVWLYKNFK